jgi:hypothetical protein
MPRIKLAVISAEFFHILYTRVQKLFQIKIIDHLEEKYHFSFSRKLVLKLENIVTPSENL